MFIGLAFTSSTVGVETVVPALGHVDARWKSKYWGGWVRTTNLLVNSQALCRLSYAPFLALSQLTATENGL